LDLRPLKHSPIEVEQKQRRKTLDHRRKAFITNEHRQIASLCITSIIQRAPTLSPMIEGTCCTDKRWSAQPRARNANESKTINEDKNPSMHGEACHSESHIVVAHSSQPR
jgi:hypothetical protein